MDLKPLLHIQQDLDNEINRKHPKKEGENRLFLKCMALFVEAGECLNEHRSFKYWSQVQSPRDSILCSHCAGKGFIGIYKCPQCDGSGDDASKNPLLEEFADMLSFALSIANDTWKKVKWEPLEISAGDTVPDLFYWLFLILQQITDMSKFTSDKRVDPEDVTELFQTLYEIAQVMGFTDEQVRQAYLKKNRINHNRQASGY